MQLWGIRIKRLHGLRKATKSDLTQVPCSGRASILSVLTRALGILRAESDSPVESGNLVFRTTRSGESQARRSAHAPILLAPAILLPQTAMVFLSPAASPALLRMKRNWSKPPSSNG